MPFNAYFVLSILFSILHIVWHEKRWNHLIYFWAKGHAEIECPCWYSNGLQSTELKNCFGNSKVIFFRPWISRERCFNCIFIYAWKTLAMLPAWHRGCPGGLTVVCAGRCRISSLSCSSTFYKILPHNEFMLLSAHHVFYPSKFCIVPVSGWISRDFSRE